MAPPAYVDLGKSAHDIVNKGYHIGFWRFDCKTKTKHDIELITYSKSDDNMVEDIDGLIGSVGAKYSVKDYGLEFTDKWDTKQKLNAGVSCKDYLAEGLKLALEGTYGIKTGDLTGKFKLGYGQENFQFNLDFKLESSPILKASIVGGYEGFVAGYENTFDIGQTALGEHSFALGFSNPDFSFIAAVEKEEIINASIHGHCMDNLDIGCLLKWLQEGNNLQFDIAVKYQLNEDSVIRARFSLQNKIFLGFQQKLHEGIQLFLSARNNMRFGAALEFEA